MACFMQGLAYISLHGSVNLALVNAFGIYIASKFFFSVIKAWVLHRHLLILFQFLDGR